MTVETLHQRLRAATHAAHEDLEATVVFERQVVSREAYAGYLLRLLGAHRAAEVALVPFDFAAVGFDYSVRTKSSALMNDLDCLGEDHLAPSEGRMRPFRLASEQEALGCVYVIEGSALGARAVLPLIKRELGFDERAGASYFAGLGEEGKLIWRACLNAINAMPSQSDAADRVIAGALATFAMFKLQLSQPSAACDPPNVWLA